MPDYMRILQQHEAEGACSSAPSIKCEGRELLRKRKFKKRLRDSDEIIYREPTPIHESETRLCVALWRSVIIQALYDISTSSGYRRRLAKAESLAWFASLGTAQNDNVSQSLEGRKIIPQSDFELVCELANLNPEKILLMVKQICEKGGGEAFNSLNSRSFRKDYSNRRGTRTPRKKSGNI